MVRVMRKGRYRKNLLTREECPAFALRFSPVLQSALDDFHCGALRDVDFAATYVWEALKILRPDSWKGSRRDQGNAQNALDAFRIFSMRGIPESAHRSLLQWENGNYPLKLFFDIPGTGEVLDLQSQGVRCVTCLTDQVRLSSYVLNERDPISFALHDLIHADHFLCDPEQRQVQIGFSKWMRELWKSPSVQVEIAKSPLFANQFEYACADMNSHGAHLVKYLKAIFCQNELESLLHSELQTSRFSDSFRVAVRQLNTPNEKPEHLSLLQNELFLKGAASAQNQKNHSVTLREILAN